MIPPSCHFFHLGSFISSTFDLLQRWPHEKPHLTAAELNQRSSRGFVEMIGTFDKNKHCNILWWTYSDSKFVIQLVVVVYSYMGGGARMLKANPKYGSCDMSGVTKTSALPRQPGCRSSSSPRPSSSSSMERPSLIIRWMRPANWVGSSRLKPEVSNEVSKSNQIKSFTVLSDLSAAAFFLNCHGLPGDFVHKFVI